MLLISVVLATLVTSNADSLTARQRARIDSVFSVAIDSTTPGCAVGVFRNGETVFANGYGLADLSHRVPIMRTTRFRIASMSKQFTAHAIVALANQGKLKLDDDVRRYVPELPTFSAPITIRHLLTHTSGLRDYSILIQLADWPGAVSTGDEIVTLRDFWSFTSKQRALNFAPGTDWLYNNTGYVLLGLIVEKVTGQPLRDVYRRELFEPLGMTSSDLPENHTVLVPQLATGYVRRRDAWRIAAANGDVVGASGIISTIDDLAAWNRNYADHRVGSAELVASMEKATTLSDGRVAGYGFGLVRGTLGTHHTVSHSGGLVGYSSDLLRIPDRQLGVAVLCNRRAPEASTLAEQAARIILEEPQTVAETVSDEEARAMRFDSTYVGTYVNSATDAWLRIAMTADGLAKSEAGGALVPLQPARRGEYTGSGATWTFKGRGAMADVTVDRHGLPPNATYRRVAPKKSPTTGLAGTYWSPEINHALKVSVKDSAITFLMTESNAPMTLTEPYTSGYVYGPVTVHFLRPTPNAPANALTLTLYGVRRLRYERR